MIEHSLSRFDPETLMSRLHPHRQHRSHAKELTPDERALCYSAMQDAPEGAQTYFEGKFYKLSRGRVWYHDGIEWCLSTRTRSEIGGL